MKLIFFICAAAAWLATISPANAQTWTKTSAPGTNWQSIAASADGSKLVALAEPSAIFYSTNSGVIWRTATNEPALVRGTQWSSLAGSADGSTWAATAYYTTAAPGNGGAFVSTNYGIGWM